MIRTTRRTGMIRTTRRTGMIRTTHIDTHPAPLDGAFGTGSARTSAGGGPARELRRYRHHG
jgi:hypothetical protein